jgi:hypothetical protein
MMLTKSPNVFLARFRSEWDMASALAATGRGFSEGMSPKNRACEASVGATAHGPHETKETGAKMSDQLPSLSELGQEPSHIRVTLKPSHRPNVLASVTVELETDLGTVTINDARILRNKAGVAWFALPTYSVTSGREYQYFASVELSPTLHRQVSDAALAGFVKWEKAQPQLGGDAR